MAFSEIFAGGLSVMIFTGIRSACGFLRQQLSGDRLRQAGMLYS